jgi:hypothetical protein
MLLLFQKSFQIAIVSWLKQSNRILAYLPELAGPVSRECKTQESSSLLPSNMIESLLRLRNEGAPRQKVTDTVGGHL